MTRREDGISMVAVVRPPCDEVAIRAKPATAQCATKSAPWVLAATILGSSLAFIDGTVVNIALPALQRDLHATTADVQWVIEAYSLFLSALILVGGALGDRLGRRRIFVTGIALFTAASVLCGLAPGPLVLILARAVQGIGGALLIPGSLAIISASFDEQRRGRAIGTWAGFTTVTSALGPLVGGWLIQTASWRWIFFLNLPLALITVAITLRHVPESRDPAATGPLDWRGAALVTLGLGALVFGLIHAGVVGLGAPLVLVSLLIGVGALVAFFFAETHIRPPTAPMVPLRLFRSRTFSGVNLMTLLLYAGLGGALYFLPFNLQQVQGYSAVEAGAALLPMTIIIFVLSRWAGGLVDRYGARPPLVVGSFIAAIGFALFAVPSIGGSYWTTYFPATVVLSLGMAIVIAPLTTTVMNAVPPAQVGTASGINNAVSRVGGLLAIAVFTLIVVAVFSNAFTQALAALPLSPALHDALVAQRTQLAGIQLSGGESATTQSAVTQAIGTAYVRGFRVAMLLASVLALASSLVAALTLRGKPKPEPQ